MRTSLTVAKPCGVGCQFLIDEQFPGEFAWEVCAVGCGEWLRSNSVNFRAKK
jgi:hypothetical protein